MVNTLSQTLENTSAAMQTLHSAVTTLHTASQRGTITRMIDVAPGACVFIAVCVVVALALIGALVWLAMTERATAERLNAYIPSEPVSATTTIVDCVKTRNLKGA